jgi:preprotein translocase subunit SecD
MELYRDKKLIFMLALFIVLFVGIYLYPTFSGLLLIFALMVFGTLCLFWKEPHIKLGGLALLVILALANISLNSMKFGIDFSGGTRIPVLLERSVSQETMNEMVDIIKKRTSEFGLTENKVYALGNNQINVEIPSSDEERIKRVEDVLSHQGIYMGIVDGKVAVSGDHIFTTSIMETTQQQLMQTGADWGVSFSVDREGAEQFAKAAYGKADYPVYMYLDRPMDADIFYTREQIRDAMLEDSGEKESMNALRDALELEDEGENATINVYILDDLDLGNLSITPRTNKTLAIISEDAPDEYKNTLRDAGYALKEVSKKEITPEFSRTRTGVLVVDRIEAVGLLSAPVLSSALTTGIPNYNYAITGGVTAVDPTAKAQEAQEKQESIVSILKGGALPVEISIGSRTVLPASLGSEFLNLSLIGIAAALVVISVLIGIRYMNIRATMPIVAISLAELVILLSILGSFTIDLPAMAGIIAAIGVGVDAQIVITDEILKKDKREIYEKIGGAFDIIRTNVIVAMLSMLPLLFSQLVEVIGFAISTMLGSLLGYLLSRPAYAAIVEKIMGKGGEEG